MKHNEIDRRSLLRGLAVGGGALAGASLFPNTARALVQGREERKTKRIVLVAFAGGVRTRDSFGTPANVPNLSAMAEEGVLYSRVRSANLGHFGAALSIFTGVSEPRGIRENARGPHPTVFEYVRRDNKLPASDVWITTSGGAQQTNYSYGLHPDYGPRFGANTLDGDGIFNAEFKSMLEAYGRPREMGAEEEQLLTEMRASIGSGGIEEGLNSAESARELERYILDELARGTVDIRGPNAADAKALRVARNLISIFRPTLVGVVLQQADAAHGSFNTYSEIIRRNDAALGELWNAVRADPELRDSTAFFVVPEFGRDRDLNARRGLDHGDGSDDLNYVSAVCWGPEFHRGRTHAKEVHVTDFCATVCHLLGADPRFSRGKRLPRLLS